MNQQTINDAVTIGGEQMLLANRYRVVRKLGQGGMGNVYLAEDTQLDNFKVAIKMLPAILAANKRALAQIKAEALVSMKLVHSNIVPLRGFEENNGYPFLVMDYVEGRTLDDYLAEKGTLSEVETVKLLKPIAAALDYAHVEGVIHRDVKPGNVMIRKDGRPFILDFGIAREIQETMTHVTGQTVSGTLSYMSPEQLMGAPPKPAQDVYSFSAMVYECLKGEPPFPRGQIDYQIMNMPPTPLPGGVNSVASSVMAGLAKKPKDRPPTCTAVLEMGGFSHNEHKDRKGSGGMRLSRPETGSPHYGAVMNGILAAALFVVIVGAGLWWAIGSGQGKEISPTRSERGVLRKVQLWEGGPYWACKNIGAEEPWDYGYYFWWGDTVGYKFKDNAWVASDGSSSDFQFLDKNTPTYKKSIATLQREGWITADGVLASKHDAAQVLWGGGWRMPTKQELDDLNSKCDWTWTTTNGVKGYVVCGKGNYASASIFLPATGVGEGTSLKDVGSYGNYWSSVPASDEYHYSWALAVYLDSHETFDCGRSGGNTVRPVQGLTK